MRRANIGASLATLLWSMALTKLNEPGVDVNFVSVVCLNLVLAGSLLMTPWVVHALAGLKKMLDSRILLMKIFVWRTT